MADGEFMWNSEPIKKDVRQENMQESLQSKEKQRQKKIESNKLTDKEIQNKNYKTFRNLYNQLPDGEFIKYMDKSWKAIRIGSNYEKMKNSNSELLEISISKFDNNKNGSKIMNSDIKLRLYKWEFSVRTRIKNNETNVQQNLRVPLNHSEVWEYLKAINNRMTDYKKAIKENFINLSVNEDKKEADNLIETIEEQTV